MQARKVSSAAWVAVFCVVMTVLPAMTASAGATQVAMVVDVQGKGLLYRAGVTQPLDILMNLRSGEALELEGGARVTVVYLGSGDEFLATGPGRLMVDATRLVPPSGMKVERRVSPLAGATGQLQAAGGVIQGAVRMRNLGAPTVRLIAPQGRQLQPPVAFSWEATRAGTASTYTFELAEDGPTGPSLLTLETGAQALTLPQGLDLMPGRAYRWSLSFLDPNGRRASLEGRFQIAGPEESARWQRLRPSVEAPLSDWVLYAGLLKEANFREEARAIWSELARQRPASAELDTLSRP
jgi:hypothetical protein